MGDMQGKKGGGQLFVSHGIRHCLTLSETGTQGGRQAVGQVSGREGRPVHAQACR